MGPYTFAFDLTSTRRVRGGIGACWHAIPGPFESHAGSAWGANPPPEDEAAWQSLYRHADLLGLGWNRVMLEQGMYLPERGHFDWDNAAMRTLYRILDWCESRGAGVFLQQMWINTAWNAHPGIAPHRSAPVDVAAFAEGTAAMVEYLVKTKGYTCIRCLNFSNEPAEGWSWWMDAEGRLAPLTPAYEAVRAALDRRGVTVPLAGPDWTHLPPCDPATIEIDHLVEWYELHTYLEEFNHAKLGESAAEKVLKGWARWANTRGKPLFLGEFGCMTHGWQYDHPAPGGFPAALKCAEIVIRGLNAGVEGFCRWSYTNQGNLDGQWQLVDTWDPVANRLLPAYQPHANSYTFYGLLSRLFFNDSCLLPVTVSTAKPGMGHYVLAAGLRNPHGDLTLIVLNNTEQDATVHLDLPGLPTATTLWRYQATQADRNQPGRLPGPEAPTVLNSTQSRLTALLPGLSLTVYSTIHLASDQPGAIRAKLG